MRGMWWPGRSLSTLWLLDALEDLPLDAQARGLLGVLFHPLALIVERGEVEAGAGVAALARAVEDPGGFRRILVDDPRATREVVRADRPACALLAQIACLPVGREGRLVIPRHTLALLEHLGQRRAAFAIFLLTTGREVLHGLRFLFRPSACEPLATLPAFDTGAAVDRRRGDGRARGIRAAGIRGGRRRRRNSRGWGLCAACIGGTGQRGRDDRNNNSEPGQVLGSNLVHRPSHHVGTPPRKRSTDARYIVAESA